MRSFFGSFALALLFTAAACGSKPAAQTPDETGGGGETPDETGGGGVAGARTVTALLTALENGDLACYVGFTEDIDSEGGHLPGYYDLCQQLDLIGQQVVLTIQPDEMPDCESAEPCGKTVTTDMVVKIEPAP